MAHEMFFLPILADALRQGDAGQALREAFARIEELGRLPQYETGFAQFKRFMEIVAREGDHRELQTDAAMIVHRFTIELAADCFEGDEDERRMAMDLIQTRPEWMQEYERVRAKIMEAPGGEDVIVFVIERDGVPIGKIDLSDESRKGSVGHIIPGFYRVLLETGRTVWAGELAREHVNWRAAFGDQPQDLAAKTEPGAEHSGRHATIDESLLEGEVRFRVWPDIESGWIGIDLAPEKKE